MKALLVLTCLACSTVNATPATSAASEVRPVGSFHALSVDTAADVELAIGPATRVEVLAPSDWLGKIETRVDARGVLHVATPGVHGHVPAIKVTITTPSLDALAITGASKLHAGKLRGKELAIDVTGAGELALDGTTEQLAIAISGEADLKAKGLVARTAAVQVSGACNGELHATGTLSAAISGTASLVVYGKPAITRAVTGLATIQSR